MTLTDIANIALEDIGAKPIGNIDGDDTLARKLKRRLPITISEVSQKRTWSCLVRTLSLARAIGKNLDGRSQFHCPRGLLKIHSPEGCIVEGKYILFYGDTLTVKCSVISENPNEWDENLRGAILAQLRADIAYMATGDTQLAAQLRQIAIRDVEHYMRNDYYRARGKRPKPPTIPEGYFWLE